MQRKNISGYKLGYYARKQRSYKGRRKMFLSSIVSLQTMSDCVDHNDIDEFTK